MIVTGGFANYGQPVGILCLDTQFPRIRGDIGNARTFGFSVRYKVVKSATVDEIVSGADLARCLLPDFIIAAKELEADGVGSITTTCGFLSIFQKEIAEAVSVPVVTSSLFLMPLVRAMVGSRPIGIITAHAGKLSQRHLEAAGADLSQAVYIRGLENAPAFGSSILGIGSPSDGTLDTARVTDEVANVCQELKADVPDIAAILFECTNLQPYAEEAQARTGLPIFGICQLVELLNTAVRVPQFEQRL